MQRPLEIRDAVVASVAPLGVEVVALAPRAAAAFLVVAAGAGDLPEGAEVTAWLLEDDAA